MHSGLSILTARGSVHVELSNTSKAKEASRGASNTRRSRVVTSSKKNRPPPMEKADGQKSNEKLT
jgi:hypothetical protein